MTFSSLVYILSFKINSESTENSPVYLQEAFFLFSLWGIQKCVGFIISGQKRKGSSVENGSLKELKKMLVEKSYWKVNLITSYTFFHMNLSVN